MSGEGKSSQSSIWWHTDGRTCPHENEHVCPTCDFDSYYATNYADCPWKGPSA